MGHLRFAQTVVTTLGRGEWIHGPAVEVAGEIETTVAAWCNVFLYSICLLVMREASYDMIVKFQKNPQKNARSAKESMA